MATRAEIITQAQIALDLLGQGLDTTDDSTGDFHFPLNYTLTQMRKTDSEVASFTDNEVRMAVIGTEYHVLERLSKRYYGTCSDSGEKKKFDYIMRLLAHAKKRWLAALAGDDIPDPIDSIAEEVLAWGSPLGDRTVDEYDTGEPAKDAPFQINEFGTDESDYSTDDDPYTE
jgi:hypothetical protein